MNKINSRTITIGRRKKIKPILVGGNNPLRIVAPFGSSGPEDLNVNLSAFIKAVAEAGADAVQELSTFGELGKIRTDLLKETKVPYGTVLTFELFMRWSKERSLSKEKIDYLTLKVLEEQIEQGIDYTTIHASLTHDLIEKTARSRSKRAIPGASRAAGMLVRLMKSAGIDNPLNSNFEKIARMCSDAKVAISLGAPFRSAAISDALDAAHLAEIKHQGYLASIVHGVGGEVMIEGLGHAVPSDIEKYSRLVTKICGKAPVTALGPLPIDVAVGMDHIAAAIGVCFASLAGISLVNVITRKEHFAMPDVYDMIEAVRAAKIGAYTAHVMKIGKKSERDLAMSRARSSLNWKRQSELALFGETLKYCMGNDQYKNGKSCSICGAQCPLRIRY